MWLSHKMTFGTLLIEKYQHLIGKFGIKSAFSNSQITGMQCQWAIAVTFLPSISSFNNVLSL